MSVVSFAGAPSLAGAPLGSKLVLPSVTATVADTYRVCFLPSGFGGSPVSVSASLWNVVGGCLLDAAFYCIRRVSDGTPLCRAHELHTVVVLVVGSPSLCHRTCHLVPFFPVVLPALSFFLFIW